MKVYERKSFPRMARDLKIMHDKKNLSFDNAVQRNFVWKNTKKDNRMSMLIDTMMRGFPIPPMYCNCITIDNKKVYDFIDGKQRTTAIIKFLNNEFALIGVPTYEEPDSGEVYDFNGKYYKDLPEDIQDKIKTYSLTVYYYDNMDQDDAEEMFRRLNNGKSLTAIELSRANAVSKDKIATLGKHELFKKVLSEKVLLRYTNEDIVVKTWIELFANKKSFEVKDVRPQLRECEITDEQMQVIEKIYDFYLKLLNDLSDNHSKICKKISNKIQLISLAYIIKKVNDEKIDVELLNNWVVSFFETGNREITVNKKYNENSKGREAVTEKSVKIRMKILEDSFNEFLEEKHR